MERLVTKCCTSGWEPETCTIPFRNIDQIIHYSFRLEGLTRMGKLYPEDHECPSCMIGKSTFKNYPGSKEPDHRPMTLVHIDVYSSSVTSIEGYHHALIITDSCSEHCWQFGMKSKNEVLAMSKKWNAESADIQKDHPVLFAGQIIVTRSPSYPQLVSYVSPLCLQARNLQGPSEVDRPSPGRL
jgi:hypothetical protein